MVSGTNIDAYLPIQEESDLIPHPSGRYEYRLIRVGSWSDNPVSRSPKLDEYFPDWQDSTHYILLRRERVYNSRGLNPVAVMAGSKEEFEEWVAKRREAGDIKRYTYLQYPTDLVGVHSG